MCLSGLQFVLSAENRSAAAGSKVIGATGRRSVAFNSSSGRSSSNRCSAKARKMRPTRFTPVVRLRRPPSDPAKATE